jgi:BMFP domain-containing protein YqiC
MINLARIDEIVDRLTASLPPGAIALREELESQFKTILKAAFEKMDLVSREEFEQQSALLERAQLRLESLQRQLDELSSQ